jgi:hypothetical protein
VKNTFNGFLCLCFLAFSCAAQPTAAAPPDAAPQPAVQQPAAPQDDSSQPAASPQTAPPATTPPAAAPDQQTAPPATPPAAAPPAAAAPQDQTETPKPTIQAAPQLPKYPDVRLPGETGWWLSVTAWEPREQPVYNRGHAETWPQSSLITLQGEPKAVEGVDFGMAVGLHNSLTVSYFTTRAAGDTTSNVDVVLGTQLYSAGTLISTDYKLSVIKMSFNYLTWPYPVESRKYRLHTLWQIQYVSMRNGFDAPQLPLYDSAGNPLIDAAGNPLDYQTSQTKWFITPTFGLNWTQYLNKNLRLEFNGSGFLLPHHWTVWDADASLNFRLGKLELAGGLKAYHYKTSPEGEFFIQNTMASVFVGARWYF